MSSFKAHAFNSENDKKLCGVELGTNKLWFVLWYFNFEWAWMFIAHAQIHSFLIKFLPKFLFIYNDYVVVIKVCQGQLYGLYIDLDNFFYLICLQEFQGYVGS
jgi:hypothetical protein